ncbi:FeoB-associated Cys-rich membrane protein [Acutalibacter sp. 1XD8-33]|uniref:FeoB-associated Cys-rich membrane protein n=1 Tax=Acutalibacter sp. 1XD8-33 TaxID=2320081 RepID=UPI000EA272E0|nr:FeoB-associated Cys-rich membrane protein [Acutalibacter sp. 1XD8-33]RKJ38981.1 FeoB-associated Cys-rich membrane protein [Acutalibacter sp. 1XD8-33]
MLLSTGINLPTVLIGAIIAVIFVAILLRGIRRRKKGESGCGCGCSSCPNRAVCHTGQEEKPDGR